MEISEGGFSDDGFWRNVKHFNYKLLRDSFQTALLNELQEHLGPAFKKVKSAIYYYYAPIPIMSIIPNNIIIIPADTAAAANAIMLSADFCFLIPIMAYLSSYCDLSGNAF